MLGKTAKAAPQPSIPFWPGLSAREKEEALESRWSGRVRAAFAWAALLALAAGGIGLERAPGWRAVWDFCLFAAFVVCYFRVETARLPSRWLALIGLTTIVVTEINLSTFTADLILAGASGDTAVGDPALVLLAAACTIWALRTHLSPQGFATTAFITAAILWCPWAALTRASVELGFAAAASFAGGGVLRWVEAERAYDVYRRETVWPRMWRESLRIEVELRLLELDAAVNHPVEPTGLDDETVEESIARLAATLGRYETTSPERAGLAEGSARNARRAGSRA